MRQAVVLVGGLGTRLGAFTAATPKPLLAIDDQRCFLDYLIEQLARHGVSEIILVAGHLGEQIEARYRQSPAGCEVIVVQEPARAGTAGALLCVRELLDPQFLMMNGDSFFDINVLALSGALSESDIGALALRHVADASRYGGVEYEGDRVLAFREKQAAPAGGGWISAGVYLLRKAVLDEISPGPCSIEVDVFPGLAAAGRLAALPLEGYFIDIGLPDTLARGRRELPQIRRRPAVFFGPNTALQVDRQDSLHPAALELAPDAATAIRTLNDLGWFAVIAVDPADSQSAPYNAEEVRRLHTRLQARLAPASVHVDAVFHRAPAAESDVDLSRDNPLRRDPGADTLAGVVSRLPIETGRSVLIYDEAEHAAAARAIGLRAQAHVRGGLADQVAAIAASGPSHPAAS